MHTLLNYSLFVFIIIVLHVKGRFKQGFSFYSFYKTLFEPCVRWASWFTFPVYWNLVHDFDHIDNLIWDYLNFTSFCKFIDDLCGLFLSGILQVLSLCITFSVVASSFIVYLIVYPLGSEHPRSPQVFLVGW